MNVIGITGGVGAGKSEVMKYLQAQYGAFIIKADEVGHLALAKDGKCYDLIANLFGDEVLDTNGEFDRSKIAAKVFSHKELLEALNGIVHPFVREYIEAEINIQRQCNRKYFFIEAALLLEAQYDQICDELWYVYATEEVRHRRLVESRHYSDEKVKQIMDKQLSEAEFKRGCDLVIDNSGTWEDSKKQIDARMQRHEDV